MQIFFAISCALAVLALANGASLVPKLEVGESRAGLEAQVAETASQSRAVQTQTNDEVAADAGKSAAVDDSASLNEESTGAVREKRTLLRHLLRLKGKGGCAQGGCSGGCGQGGCSGGCGAAGCGQTVNPCAMPGGCGQAVNPCAMPGGCGGPMPSPCALPGGCGQNVVVVPRPVPVAQPVRVPVEVVKVVRHPVPVPQPVPVPVTKFVPVPVPVQPSCCSQPQPCCGQAPLPCSPCSG